MDTKLAWMHKEHERYEMVDTNEELDAIEEAFKGWRYGYPSIEELLNLQDLEAEGFTPLTVSNGIPF